MTIQSSTLRPGLLVSLKTSVAGGVRYVAETVEPDHTIEGGALKAVWQTTRVIDDPAEHEAAVKIRSKVRTIISGVCAASAFGLLCPEDKAPELERAMTEARALAEAFNRTARLNRVSVYIITGRVAPDDVEAVKAINSEVRDLLEAMSRGVQDLDVKRVREAADRARQLGAMLSPDAAARIQIAIDTARSAARKIVKAGEQAAQEIDTAAVRKITEQRTAFLDLDPAQEVAAPEAEARGVDLAPEGGDVIQPVRPVAPVSIL